MNNNSLTTTPLILASASPRRKVLMESLGFSFSIRKPYVEELTDSPNGAVEVATQNASLKAAKAHSEMDADVICIGADTIVVLNGKILGKPTSPEHAAEILSELSGNTHAVITGMCLISKATGASISATRSDVTFRDLSSEEIRSYCDIAEPYDKAGAYGIQGVGSTFIEKIDGLYTNVMGFPIETFLRELTKLTGKSPYEFAQRRDS